MPPSSSPWPPMRPEIASAMSAKFIEPAKP